MPTWGLTKEQRDMSPWDLHPKLLMPRKVTTDPVHEDIHTTVLEQAIVDTAPFQRLRRVRQLGTTHEVYPGATHTRFSHSLGALRVVQDLLDGVMTQREGRHPVPDLVTQWFEADAVDAGRHIAQSVVLARLGALLHDLCHVPFGHSIEDDLKVLVPHDENGLRFTMLWAELAEQLPDRVRRHLGGEDGADAVCATLPTLLDVEGALHKELRPLIISKDAAAKRLAARSAMEYPFAMDLVGNTICADLLDYLLRDHLYTGLPASLGHRFTSAFFIAPDGRGPYSRRVALNITQDGYERTDVISELLKALRYRYELSERALYHHAKLAADVMVGKALDLWARAVWLQEAEDVIATLDTAEQLVEALDEEGVREAATRTLRQAQAPTNEAERAPPPASTKPGAEDGNGTEGSVTGEPTELIGAESQAPPAWANLSGFAELVPKVNDDPDRIIVDRQQLRLEKEVLAHGDDGLLERLAALGDEPEPAGLVGPLVQELRRQAGQLGRSLLDRELFAVGGRVGIDDAPADKLYNEFGSIAARTTIQLEAQRFAEIGREPQVLIWLPDPDMRLKLARVLVDNGEHINEFQAYEEARGRRGGDIYSAHRRLWSLWVFCDRRLNTESRDAVLVFLAARFGVAWERMRDRYGHTPGEWIVRHGLSRLLNVDPLDRAISDLIPLTKQIAARGPELPTVNDVEAALRQVPAIAKALAAGAG